MATISPATAFRAAQPQGEKLLSALGVGMLYAAMTKGVGSAFRVLDDRLAPQVGTGNTIRRESLTVLLTSICGGGVKLLYNQAIKTLTESTRPAFKGLGQKLGKVNEPVTVGLICMGTALAEVFSRKIAPRNIWDNVDKTMRNEAKSVEKTLRRDDGKDQPTPSQFHRSERSLDLTSLANEPTIKPRQPVHFSHSPAPAGYRPSPVKPYPYRPFIPF